MARGGYQRPTSPAPVSGPGALSQRTDGGPGSTQAAQYVSGLPYGEGQELMSTQSAASMEAAPSIPALTPSQMEAAGQQSNQSQQEAAPIVPLGAPTQRPDEPISHGADFGPGPGMASLGLTSPAVASQQNVASIVRAMATSHNASPALISLAQKLSGGVS
jgi:hypothetical protein